MKRFWSVSAVLILPFTMAAMSDEPKDKANSAKDKADKAAIVEKKTELTYYPLEVGNTWNYKIGDNRYSLKVTKHEKIGDLDCARVEMIVDGKVLSFEDIAVTNEGVVRVAYDDKKADPPLLFFKLPPKKDETWKVNSVVGKTDKTPGETVTGTFKSGEERVQVPGLGSYDAITSSTQDLDANGMKLTFTYYFVKNIGMVKQIIDVAGQKVIIELMNFEKAKK